MLISRLDLDLRETAKHDIASATVLDSMVYVATDFSLSTIEPDSDGDGQIELRAVPSFKS